MHRLIPFLAVLFWNASAEAQPTPEDTMTPILYHLTFSEPQAHLVDVEMRIPPAGEPLEIRMPVWTPGSYMVREYSRNVQELVATGSDGQPLDVLKIRKNRWRITGAGDGEVTVRYRVYGRVKSVRSNWIDSDYALINGAPTFFTVAGRENSPHHIRITPPRQWEKVISPLPTATVDGHTWYKAENLDTVVDSPFLVGNPAVYTFEIDGKPVSLVNQGEGGLWDGEKAARDVETICRAYGEMYGGFPFDRYVFFNLIVESGGGLEHKDSSVLMASRYAYRDHEKYIHWLRLVSHEFLHVWNVKRSRPAELGPFDYENEVYSRSLWVAEGLTAHYESLVPHRAGLTTRKEFLETMEKNLHRLAAIPGREHQSLEDSSFDAWIKLYRGDENTTNTTVSYYLKGALVGWLLDTEIRKRTRGEGSLDDLMRLLFNRYSGERGFTPEDLQSAAEEIAGDSLENFFASHVRGTAELDFTTPLEYFGLRLAAPEDSTEKAWLGIETKAVKGLLVVTRVRADGPALDAGLNAEDEILAIGGYRVTQETLKDRLKQYAPGDRVEILVSRFDEMRVVPLTLGTAPGEGKLEVDPEASEEALSHLDSWLGVVTPEPVR